MSGSLRGDPLRRLGRVLHARLIYPGIVHARGEREVFRMLDAYRRLERCSSAVLRRRQGRRLAAILEHAGERSPYYRDAWPASGRVRPGEARKLLATLPPLSKEELQRHADRLRTTPRHGRVTRKTTGGSTGQAVTVYKDRRATAREMAASWLGYGWFGIEIGDRAARFWGSPYTWKRRVRFAAADLAMHRIRFSAFAFDEDDLERYWARCLRFGPQYFYGYVSMLDEFARFLRRRGHDGRRLGLKAIVATSEVLSSAQRALLSDVFGAPVQNEYGCGEVGPIAYECERGGLHVMADNLVVELLTDEGRPARVGETGEVVVTDLTNRAMPLVRYRLGDWGVWADGCECGRPFPVLERIWGRAYDFIQTPGGHRYHGEFLMYLFEELRDRGVDVRQFQVTQRAEDRVDVAVVLDDRDPASASERIRRRLERRLSGVQVTVRRVSSIERAPSGKMRVLRNPWLRGREGERQPSVTGR